MAGPQNSSARVVFLGANFKEQWHVLYSLIFIYSQGWHLISSVVLLLKHMTPLHCSWEKEKNFVRGVVVLYIL